LHFRFLGVLQGNWNFALQEIKLIFGLEIARRRPSMTQLKILLRRICQRVQFRQRILHARCNWSRRVPSKDAVKLA
jgi:hypothetical protein